MPTRSAAFARVGRRAWRCCRCSRSRQIDSDAVRIVEHDLVGTLDLPGPKPNGLTPNSTATEHFWDHELECYELRRTHVAIAIVISMFSRTAFLLDLPPLQRLMAETGIFLTVVAVGALTTRLHRDVLGLVATLLSTRVCNFRDFKKLHLSRR